MNNFFTVFQQVLILFLLMTIGYYCNKSRKLSKEANKCISDVVTTIVVPCVIIQSFEREFDPSMFQRLLAAFVAAIAAHACMIIAVHFLIRTKDDKRSRVLRFASVFSNAGFMSIPLQSALLGNDGVFCGAAYVVVFNIAIWSYGIVEMSGDKSYITPKKLLVSPGIIGVVVGMILFLCSIRLPMVVQSTIGYVASLNVPLPMFLIGYYLADTNIIDALKDRSVYICLGLRLLVFPLLGLGIMYLLGFRGVGLIAIVIALSAPVGATISMFAEKFDADTEYSAKLVSISTLLSIITMPVVVGIAQALA